MSSEISSDFTASEPVSAWRPSPVPVLSSAPLLQLSQAEDNQYTILSILSIAEPTAHLPCTSIEEEEHAKDSGKEGLKSDRFNVMPKQRADSVIVHGETIKLGVGYLEIASPQGIRKARGHNFSASKFLGVTQCWHVRLSTDGNFTRISD